MTAPISGVWNDTDRAAVLALVHQYQREGVYLRTAQSRARRAYFQRTGRVPAHNASGYKTGCRCGTCRPANMATIRRYRARVKAKAAAATS